MAKFTFKIYSRYAGCDTTEEIEIDDNEMQGLSTTEREDYINAACRQWMLDTVEWGWEEE